jgi:hypothetical protein
MWSLNLLNVELEAPFEDLDGEEVKKSKSW